MKNIKMGFISTVIFLSSILFSSHLYAHVMVAQHGTLNVVDNDVFMVLSLPVSAFEGVDDENLLAIAKLLLTLFISVLYLKKIMTSWYCKTC